MISKNQQKTEELDPAIRELADIKYALSESAIVAFTDKNGRITYVNDQFCRISKYVKDELIGQDHRIINSGFHSKEFFAGLWNTISSGEIWRGEIRNRAKDGSIYWVATTIVPFLDQNGEPYQYAAIRFDISSQKEIEQALVSQKELIEQTHDAIYIWNLDDGLIYWNRNAEKLYGYSFDEVAGKEVYEVLKNVYPVSFEEYFSELKKNGKWQGAIKQTTKNGVKITVESRQAVREGDGNRLIVLETSRDITEQLRATERIKQQASLLEKTSDAIVVCDLNHKIIFWNLGAERVYGFTSPQVLGKDICDTICDGDHSLIRKALESLETRDDWQEEANNFTSDGKQIPVMSRWTLVRNDLGQPDYFLVVNTDISDLKHTERQLLRAQRLESIGTLAGGIAHDVNNALSPILMAADMLRSDEGLPESSRQWVSIIRENTERGADLIKQVLMFARGTGEGNRVQLQPRHLIKELVKVLQKTFPRDIEVKYLLESDLDSINADPTQIHQVLMNLAVNAKDAIADTGGKLTIHAENINLDGRVAPLKPDADPGRYVLITVSDTGAGMTSDTLNRIWDPFFTTKEIGKGTGLGLSTAHSIVENHGGFMDVFSKPELGTRFLVYLPSLEKTAVESDKETARSHQLGKGELILFVDDEADILKMASATLEKSGFRTRTALSGSEALDIYSQNKDVDLVVTDMAMPDLDGRATILALKKLDPKVRIIAVSGLGDAYHPESEALGIDGFVSKPFSAEILLEAVEKVLRT